MVELAENQYGKSRVRLMKVTRHPDGNDLREWTVQVLLRGDFALAHLTGNNSSILPTDTMKNTVYSIARSSQATCMEEYAKELVDFLLSRNPQVSSAAVRIESTMWKRLTVDNKPHSNTFMRGSEERQTASVERTQRGAFKIVAGLDNMVILKTAHSGFEGFIKDSLTTLSETRDRIFGTALTAEWQYEGNGINYDAVRLSVREALLRAFAEHDSKSVQQTLYAMAEQAIAAVPEVSEIEMTMPNKHCLLVDLSRFGQDNPNEIFIPTDEPYGYIQARITRKA